MEEFKTMREVFNKLRENPDAENKISLSEDGELITAEFHELLQIQVDDDYLSFRSGRFDHHWHPTLDDTYRLLSGLLCGEILFVLYRGGWRRLLNLLLVGSRLREIPKEKFETEKVKLMKNWSVKSIFSGKTIFK